MSRRIKFRTVLVALVPVAMVSLAAFSCQSTAPSDPSRADLRPRDAKVEVLSAAPEPLGPTGVEHGVPVGWRHDVAGAEAAAAAFVEASAEVLLAGPLERRDVILTMSTPEFGSVHVQVNDLALDELEVALAEQGLRASDLFWSEHALRVDSATSSEDEVEVSVWSVVVYGVEDTSAARQMWRTSALTMRWVDGDWKVDDWVEETGPFPAMPAEADISSMRSVEEVSSWARVPGGSD